MGFKIDHSQGDGFEQIKPGEYEVKPINYTLDKAKTGSNMVIVDYEIRSDVDQPCQGQKIMYDNFVVSDNSMWRFHQASKAAGFPDGKEFESFRDWCEEFMNKPIRILTVLEKQTNGREYAKVKSFLPSNITAPPVEEVKTPSDDKVPF